MYNIIVKSKIDWINGISLFLFNLGLNSAYFTAFLLRIKIFNNFKKKSRIKAKKFSRIWWNLLEIKQIQILVDENHFTKFFFWQYSCTITCINHCAYAKRALWIQFFRKEFFFKDKFFPFNIPRIFANIFENF